MQLTGSFHHGTRGEYYKLLLTKISLICCSNWILLISKILCFCAWDINNPTIGSVLLVFPQINEQFSQIEHNTRMAPHSSPCQSFARVLSFQPSSWSQWSSLLFKGARSHQWNHLLCVWKRMETCTWELCCRIMLCPHSGRVRYGERGGGEGRERREQRISKANISQRRSCSTSRNNLIGSISVGGAREPQPFRVQVGHVQ